jgi:transposase
MPPPPPSSTESLRTLRSIAARVRFLTNQATELDIELPALVPQHPAGRALLREPGVGPVVAAQLLVSWSHRGPVRNEAAFASLAGAAPLEASSGQRTRHRLSRIGDRNLNRAFIPWRSHVFAAMNSPATTRRNAALRARPTVTSDGA